MEAPLKELAKLEKLTSKSSAKSKFPSITDSLDSLLQSLHDAKDELEAGAPSSDVLAELAQTIDSKKKEVDDRQKEVYSSVARLGKALDKVISTLPLESIIPMAAL